MGQRWLVRWCTAAAVAHAHGLGGSTEAASRCSTRGKPAADAALLPSVCCRRRRDPATYAWMQGRSRMRSPPYCLWPSCRDPVGRHADAVDEEHPQQRGLGDRSGNGRCRSSGRRSRGRRHGTPRSDSFCQDVQGIETELLDKISERSDVVGRENDEPRHCSVNRTPCGSSMTRTSTATGSSRAFFDAYRLHEEQLGGERYVHHSEHSADEGSADQAPGRPRTRYAGADCRGCSRLRARPTYTHWSRLLPLVFSLPCHRPRSSPHTSPTSLGRQPCRVVVVQHDMHLSLMLLSPSYRPGASHRPGTGSVGRRWCAGDTGGRRRTRGSRWQHDERTGGRHVRGAAVTEEPYLFVNFTV